MRFEELLEYKIKQLGNRYVLSAAKQGELYADKLKYIVDDGHVKIGYMKPNKQWISIYLFVDDSAEGALEINLVGPHVKFVKSLQKLIGERPICIPHIAFTDKLRGKGYASAMYKIALDRGCVLATYGHTQSAKALWDGLKDYDHAYFTEKDGLTTTPSRDAVRLVGKNLLPARINRE